MAQHFTVAQAEALLAEVEPELRQAISNAQQLAQVVAKLEEVSRHVTFSGGALIDRQGLAATRARGDALASRIKEAVEAIQEHGCLIKDLDMGLIDFPATFRGREVYLCWKLGENGIQFWHEVDAGYRGRKPIDKDFLQNISA